MKLKSTLWALAFACAAVSCSDELEGGPNGGDGTLSGEKGYAKIAINLPTTSGVSTRAANDKFDDGTLGEYTVNDAYLLIFDGDGDNASLSSWYQLNHGFPNTEVSTDVNITVTSTITQEIVPPQSRSAYALVVLNNNSVLTFGGTQVEDITNSGNSVTYNNSDVSTLGSLYAALSTDVSTFTGSNENSFTMTNAPISDYAGDQLASVTEDEDFVHTLVHLNIYPNEDQALAAPGDPIYVERVVAKVTVNAGLFKDENNTGQYSATVSSDNNYDGDKVYLDGWYLNVTNKSTKFVRDVEDATIPDYKDWKGYQNATSNQSSVNRFFGTTANLYRVYWAIDPNYNNTWPTDDTAEEAALKAAFNIYGKDDYNAPYVMGSDLFTKPVYCLENTFATTNMYKRETTGIVFRMTYVMGNETPQTFFIMGDVATSKPLYATEFVDAVNTALNGQSFTVELKSSAKGGYYDTAAEIKNLFQKASAGGDLDDTEAEAVLKACDGMIRVYENGTTYYYAAQIEHFGDTYCAYTSGEYDAEKHLGRYGVVRNNWYELSIASISGPGRPTPPDPTDPEDPDNPDPDDPDDGGSQWIALNVNVLSWAKREQRIDF